MFYHFLVVGLKWLKQFGKYGPRETANKRRQSYQTPERTLSLTDLLELMYEHTPIGPQLVSNKNSLESDPLRMTRLIIDKSHGANLKMSPIKANKGSLSFDET